MQAYILSIIDIVLLMLNDMGQAHLIERAQSYTTKIASREGKRSNEYVNGMWDDLRNGTIMRNVIQLCTIMHNDSKLGLGLGYTYA